MILSVLLNECLIIGLNTTISIAMDATKFENLGSLMEQSVELPPTQKDLSEHAGLEESQIGPVFVKLPDRMGWIKVNNFSACDQCRTSHVKCSLSVTGGPCSHCKNRNQLCKVYGWVFNPECSAYHIYKPVLPPPPAAPSSPICFNERNDYEFEWELLIQKLNWLQRDAPRKFRKRSSAMPWKDEANVAASEANSRKLLPPTQIQCLDKLSQNGSVSGHLCKRRRASRGSENLNWQYGFEGEKPALPSRSAQHRMSISFMLSPCNSEQISKSAKKNEGSTASSNGWESRRTSLASSEADWSTRSDTRSPSLPAVNSTGSSPKATNSSSTSIRSPPVPHIVEKQEILSKFKQWRPPFNSPFISAKGCTFSSMQRF